MVSKILKNVAVVSVVFSSVMFVGCGESESDLKNLALEKCKDKTNKELQKNSYVSSLYEKVEKVEIKEIRKHNMCMGDCPDLKQALCEISYVAKKDLYNGKVKKGEIDITDTLINLEKKSGKWVAEY